MISLQDKRIGMVLAIAILGIYSVLAVVAHSDGFIWDEGRYVEYAKNLAQGFYASDDNPDFTNGPGYPFVLYPIAAADLSLVFARLLNAVFVAAACWLVWATVRHYAGHGWAVVAALFVALHPSLLRLGPFIMTEPLAVFCIATFAWSFCKAIRSSGIDWKAILVAAFALGWLMLTRVFFGPVIMATTIIAVLLWLLAKWMRRSISRALIILGLAFAMCIPYLAYTQAKTGRFLCWSTNSGELHYWLTSHNEGENGHWFSSEAVFTRPELKVNHETFYRKLLTMRVLDRDEAFKQKAREQFRSAPLKVAYNWACNVSRLVLGFPRAFEAEELRTVVLVVFNGVLFLALAAGMIMAVTRPGAVPSELWLLALMAAVYLGGSTLAPSLPRYLLPVLPLLVPTVAYTCGQFYVISRKQ